MSVLVPCKSTTLCPSPTAAASTAPSPPSAANQLIVPSSCPPTSRASPAPAPPPPPPPPCSSHPRRQSRFRSRRADCEGGNQDSSLTYVQEKGHIQAIIQSPSSLFYQIRGTQLQFLLQKKELADRCLSSIWPIMIIATDSSFT